MTWSDAQLHLCSGFGRLQPIVAPVQNRQFMKPMYGLWTSTYDADRQSSAWVDWCVAEEFGDVFSKSWYVLTPDPAARVFMIDSLPDLRFLMTHYAEATDYPSLTFLDFERLAGEYDAIHLTDAGQDATRFSVPSLYGWDCESTLWFRWRFTSAVLLPAPTPPRSRPSASPGG